MKKRAILFVCHGNICRSTMAESVFTQLARQRGVLSSLRIDSAATHPDELGNPPHYGTREKLAREGFALVPHRARLLTRRDGLEFDEILGMDAANLRDMRRILGPVCRARVALLPDECAQSHAIADPWYTGNFDETFDDVLSGCTALLDRLIHTEEV